MPVQLTVYNYTGKQLYASATSSAKSSPIWKSGKIMPTATAPSVFTLNGVYDIFSFANSQYFGQITTEYMMGQYGGSAGYDPENIVITVGLSPAVMIDASGSGVAIPAGSYSLYLTKYSDSLTNAVQALFKTDPSDPTSAVMGFSMKSIFIILLVVILLAVVVAVVYYYYKRHKAGL